MMVANKIDLTQNRLVTDEEGKKKAIENGMNYYEISAKTGENISSMFKSIAMQLQPIDNSIMQKSCNATQPLASLLASLMGRSLSRSLSLFSLSLAPSFPCAARARAGKVMRPFASQNSEIRKENISIICVSALVLLHFLGGELVQTEEQAPITANK